MKSILRYSIEQIRQSVRDLAQAPPPEELFSPSLRCLLAGYVRVDAGLGEAGLGEAGLGEAGLGEAGLWNALKHLLDAAVARPGAVSSSYFHMLNLEPFYHAPTGGLADRDCSMKRAPWRRTGSVLMKPVPVTEALEHVRRIWPGAAVAFCVEDSDCLAFRPSGCGGWLVYRGLRAILETLRPLPSRLALDDPMRLEAEVTDGIADPNDASITHVERLGPGWCMCPAIQVA